MTTTVPKSNEDAILIVDDDADVRKLLRTYLTSQFSKIYEADSGEVALKCVENHTIPIALVDIGLPDMSGLDLVDALSKASPTTSTLILTGNSDRELIRQALKRGAVDFLDKPCDPDILRNAVNRARELCLYRREMGDILEFLVCEYGRFSIDEYHELSLSQRAQLLNMVKGILALKASRKRISEKVEA